MRGEIQSCKSTLDVPNDLVLEDVFLARPALHCVDIGGGGALVQLRTTHFFDTPPTKE